MAVQHYNLILKNGRVWNGEQFLPDAEDVAIQDGRIAGIGKNLGTADSIYDVGGHILAPGLVDSHMHIRGCSPDSYAPAGEACCFPFGVTTAIEPAAGKPDGPVILDNMLLRTYVFVPAAFAEGEFSPTLTDNRVAQYGQRVLGIKLFFDSSLPVIRDVKPLQAVCRYARSRGLRVLVHSTGSPVPMAELLDTLSPGDICTHIFHGGVYNAGEDGFACLEKAIRRGIILDDGMASGAHIDYDLAREAIRRGIYPHTTGTDGVLTSFFRRGGNYGLTTCMSLNRAMGMPEEAVLRCVTGNPARALGKAEEFGFLQVGRPADICVLGYGKLHIVSRGFQPEAGYYNLLTLIGGRFVYRSNREEIHII